VARRRRRAVTWAHKVVGKRSSAGWSVRKARVGRDVKPGKASTRRAKSETRSGWVRRTGWRAMARRLTWSRSSGRIWLTYVPDPTAPSR
jgi:hypothetical protein